MTVASPTHSVYMLQNALQLLAHPESSLLAAESLTVFHGSVVAAESLTVFHGSVPIFSGAPCAQVVVMLRRR